LSSLHEFIRAAYEQAPAIREKFLSAGLQPSDIRTVSDLGRVPVTRKDELAKRQRSNLPFGGFLTLPVDRLQRIFISPGPIYDPQGPGADYWRWGQALTAAGFTRGDIVQNTFSYHLTPAGMMFDDALRHLGCTVIPAGVGNTELQVQILRELGVTGYVGVPSFLYTLLQKSRELGLSRQDIRLCKAWVAAEKLSEDLRALLARDFGVEVYQGYGTADLGCVAFECPERRGFHLADGVIVEIVDPESGRSLAAGQPGEVVVTVLEPSYPLLRFGTGDLGALTDVPCPCGRPGPRLTGILGRTMDGVKVKGLFLYPHQISDFQARFPEIKHCQAVVSQEDFRDVLTLRVEPVLGVPVDDLAARVQREAKEVLRFTCRVELVPPGTLANEKLLIDARNWD